MDLKPHWPLFKFQKDFTVKGKVKFACKVFRTEHAQFPGYPLDKDHCLLFSFGIIPKLRIWGLYIKVCISKKDILCENLVWFKSKVIPQNTILFVNFQGILSKLSLKVTN